MSTADQHVMSQARMRMMARRRRSLSVLIGAMVLFAAIWLVIGGAGWLVAALACAAGLAGYVWFLRTQAVRDHARHERTELRRSPAAGASVRRTADAGTATRGVADVAPVGSFEQPADTMVRIDDDDIELHSMDTIDLTGVYRELDDEPAAVGAGALRRAS